MKNSYTLILAASLAILLCQSCQTFNLTAVPRGTPAVEKLPPLEPQFDKASFGPNYADLYGIPSTILRGGIPDAATVTDYIGESLTVAEDTKRIYNRAILNNICESVGETEGYAVCRMGIRSKGITNPLNPVVSILTLGIANIFGYKYATFRDELEIVVDVYNLDNKVIGSFSGFGTGEADVKKKAYTVKDAKRMAHARAFSNAMEEIQEKMVSNRDKLIVALK